MNINHSNIFAARFNSNLKQNLLLLVFALLLAIFSYGFELFNFTLTIDEGVTSFMSASDLLVYPELGRWGTYWLNHLLMPESVLPYLPTLTALICLAISAFLLMATREGSSIAGMIFFVIFLSSPIHSYYLAFNTVGPYIAFGILTATLSFLFYETAEIRKKQSAGFYTLSLLGLVISLSVYQALLAYFLTLVTFYLFCGLYEKKLKNFRGLVFAVIRIGLICTLSFIIYYGIGFVHLILFSGTSNIIRNDYLSLFYSWGNDSVHHHLSMLVTFILNIFSGSGIEKFYTGIAGYAAGVMFLFMVFFIIRKKGNQVQKSFSLLLLLLLVLAPFSVMILNGNVLPTRTLMALPLMMGMMWWFVYREAGLWLRKALIAAVLVIFIGNIQKNTRMFYSSFVSLEADRVMVSRIVSRIDKLKLQPVEGHIQVAFIGIYQHPPNALFFNSGVHGNSFFQVNFRESERLKALLKISGFNKSKVIPQSEFQNDSIVQAMPSWPAQGSVQQVDATAVVKLSEPLN